jgi:hypothetical protein
MPEIDEIAKELAKEFRVITNGIIFRIEHREWCGYLWWRKLKWVPFPKKLFSLPRVDYLTYSDAQDRINREVRRMAADMCGWHTVSADSLIFER